ncbi:pigment biosynthesis protein yellowish-green 1 [Zymoseptoria brevis]|uniref:Pigment biosynthesis protein yellowish-green 1 n=1 Tax=Zymoseptoria brevis TaxID=1047168 RepID=A0A0F4GMY9_9PEZI|nr:pigment biosynthesis protein yellowish-green 1 [Zymoseptoria brevis]
MAAPGGKFFIQDAMKTPAVHHENFEKLWQTKWQPLCNMGVYPFMFSAYQDFEPIVERLIAEDQREPYDWDKYADAFFPKAEELVAIAEQAEKDGDQEKASELFLRASAVYRIARFPAPRSDSQRLAWQEGKKAARKGLAMRERPTREVVIPHKHRSGSDGHELPFYYHLPPGTTKDDPVPLVIILSGLDGYRTELVVWTEGWSQKNVATIILEIPGTGDSPANPSDPTSPERQWSTLFDWIDSQPEIDQSRKAMWAFSTGGYYAIRLAHTHANKLSGVVALGGGCHYMFDPEWLSHVNHLEYPFDLATTLAHKFGYGDDLEKFKKEAMKFSLLKDGTLDRPECTRLLLVNGVNDEIFPIDDYYLCLQHGAPKEARFVPGKKHMGEPESFFIILKWLYDLFGLEGNPADQLKTIPSRPKYL